MSDDVKNVFISHVHEDDSILKDLKDLLARSGYDIRDGSIDSSKPNQAKDPDYIKSEILAPRIRWASTMVVLISPETHTSGYVDWEIEYAHKQRKRIIGVWMQGAKDSDLPKALDKYRDALVGWQADRVMDAIIGKINQSSSPDGKELPSREIGRYKCAS